MQIMVLPFWTIVFRDWTTLYAINESKPDVASSQNIRGGLVRSCNEVDLCDDTLTCSKKKLAYTGKQTPHMLLLQPNDR